MTDFHPHAEIREHAIKAAYDLMTRQLDTISEELDNTPLLTSDLVQPDQAVTQIEQEIMDRYRSIHGAHETADAKFSVLKPENSYSYAEIVQRGMHTLGVYIKEVLPLLSEANAPLTTLSHPNSLKVIALMMRANLERDEFQHAIRNSKENIQVSSENGQTYLEVIPESFLEYFVKATDPEKSTSIAEHHKQLIYRLVSASLAGSQDKQRIWSIASTLGSIFLYNPELFAAEINSDKLTDNIDPTLSHNDMAKDEDTLQALEESTDFELMGRVRPGSPLATWLFPNGLPANPIDRYEASRVKLFGTVSYTKTRFCPAGRSLMQLFSGKSPDHNITVTYINRFVEMVGETPEE